MTTREKLGETKYQHLQSFLKVIEPKLRPYATSHAEYLAGERTVPPPAPHWMTGDQARGIRLGLMRILSRD